jgi:hypothetical protein
LKQAHETEQARCNHIKTVVTFYAFSLTKRMGNSAMTGAKKRKKNLLKKKKDKKTKKKSTNVPSLS